MGSTNAKQALQQKKQFRRKWLTSTRMVRYGINNFSRNIWLTIAATAVMSVTLLFIFVTVATRNVLADTLTTVRDQVGYSIYLRPGTSEATLASLTGKLSALDSVKKVTGISSETARSEFAVENKSNTALLAILPELDNRFPTTIRVVAYDMDDTRDIQSYIRNDAQFQAAIDPARPATFNNKTLQTIAGWGDFAQKAGVFLSIFFVLVSVLIVFNTIRMAIFNRKEEIQMMKIIGADRAFIRGPFIVESIVYGFIAALIATGLGYIVLFIAQKPLSNWIDIANTISLGRTYFPLVVLGMIVAGALVGVVSSLLATRRYLKI